MKTKLLGGVLILALVAISITVSYVMLSTRVQRGPIHPTQVLAADLNGVIDSGWDAPDGNEQIDLSASYKAVSSPFAGYGERVTYTVGIRNTRGPLTRTVLFSDVIQEGLSYVPGTLTATSGTVNDTMAPTLTWSGTLTPTPAVTISYAAFATHVGSGTATLILPQTITNTALIAAADYGPITRTATVRTSWEQVYLPAVTKNTRVPLTKADWYMAGANPQRTNWVIQEGPTNLEIEAIIPIEAYIDQRVQVITAYDTAYVASSKGLYAIDANPGQFDPNDRTQPWIRWRFDTEMPLGNSPTVHEGVVYLGGYDHNLYALDAYRGNLLWTFSEATAGYDNNPLVIKDSYTHNQTVVVIGNRDGTLYIVGGQGHPQQGQLIRKYDTGSSIQMSAAYADGVVYFAALNNYLYALNIGDMSEVWKVGPTVGDGFSAYWPVVYKDYVIFPTSAGGSIDRSANDISYWQWGRACPWRAEQYGDAEARQNWQDYQGALSGEIIDESLWPNWANGFPVIHVGSPNSLIQGGSLRVGSLSECFEDQPSDDNNGHKPWYRNQLVINRVTGEEFTTDTDADGYREYIPAIHWYTQAGTIHPVIVQPDGNVLYLNTALYCCIDPKGKVFGWNTDKPEYLSAVGSRIIGENQLSRSGARGAMAEPQAISGAGSIIYRNLCCDRIGSWFDIRGPNIREGSYWVYSINDVAPGYHDGYAILDSRDKLYGFFQGYKPYYQNKPYGHYRDQDYNSTSGIYYTIGVQNAIIPYKQRIYVHRGNSLLVFGPNGTPADMLKFPLVNIQAPASTSNVTAPDLQNKLSQEIQKILEIYTQGSPDRFLRPAYYVLRPSAYKNQYFRNPGDTLYSLSLAYEHVPEHKSQLKNYLDDFFQEYFVNDRPSQIEWTNLSPRESMEYPKEFAEWLLENPKKAQRQPYLLGTGIVVNYRYPVQNAYAIWKYVEKTQPTPQQVQQAYNIVRSFISDETPPRQPRCIANADLNGDGQLNDWTERSYTNYFAQWPFQLNAYLTGWFGFRNLHEHAQSLGLSVDQSLMDTVQKNLDKWLQFRVNNFYKDSFYIENDMDNPQDPLYDPNCLNRYGNAGYAKFKEIDIASNFMMMSPELAQYLRDNSNPNTYSNVFTALEEYQYVAPYWFVSRYDAMTNESVRAALWTYAAILQAKAWILQEPPEELVKYLDVPAFERGDLFFIQNLVAVIEAFS